MPQDRYIQIDQIKTRYWSLGDHGTKVVLIHGLGVSVEVWLRNIYALAEEHRVYALDIVGFGRSDKPPAPYSPSYLTNFIHNFMTQLKIEQTNLVGLSLGGGLALQYMLRFPNKIDKLVLVDSAGLGKETTIPLRLATIPLLGELMLKPSRRKLALCTKRIVYDPATVTDDLVEMYYKIYLKEEARRAFLKVLRNICTVRGIRAKVLYPILNNLYRITAPTLIIWGRQDRILPVKQAYAAKEKIPDSRLYIFDRCGHMPNFEHPEEFNCLVQAFLSSS